MQPMPPPVIRIQMAIEDVLVTRPDDEHPQVRLTRKLWELVLDAMQYYEEDFGPEGRDPSSRPPRPTRPSRT
jgi:hypothetical protein